MPSDASRGIRLRIKFDRVRVDRRWRQPVADHDREPARRAIAARQQLLRSLVEHPPEIGTPQIVLAVADTAADLSGLQAEIAKTLHQAGHIKGGMNGIAGARMIQGKGEQRLGRQAGAGPAKPDARRRQMAQIPQRSSRRDRCHRHVVIAMSLITSADHYSAGTEASCSLSE